MRECGVDQGVACFLFTHILDSWSQPLTGTIGGSYPPRCHLCRIADRQIPPGQDAAGSKGAPTHSVIRDRLEPRCQPITTRRLVLPPGVLCSV